MITGTDFDPYLAIEHLSLAQLSELIIARDALRAIPAEPDALVEVDFTSDAPDTEREQTAPTTPAPYARREAVRPGDWRRVFG